jgi:O-Antigen ligase
MPSLLNKYFRPAVQANLANWLVVVVAGMYNIVSIIPLTLKLPSTPFSVTYRAVYLLLSLFIIVVYFIKRGVNAALPFAIYLFLGFWVIYGLRLIYDISIFSLELTPGYDAAYFYSFAFGGCFFPAFAIGCVGKYIDYNLLIKRLFYTYLAGCTLIAIYIISNNGIGIHLFQSRGMLFGSVKNTRVINAISLSFSGAMLIFFSFTNLTYLPKSTTRRISYIALLLGFFCLLFGASRGPMLLTLLSLLFLLIYYYWHKRVKTMLLINMSIGMVLLVALWFRYSNQILKNDKIAFIYRITETFEKKHKEERTGLIEIALNDFYEKPILGKHFLIYYDGEYGFVHNVFIEVLHSTGMIGAFLFYSFILILLYKGYKLFSRKSIAVYLVGTLFLSLGLASTAGALYTSTDFWLFMSLIITMNDKNLATNFPLSNINL